MLMNGFFKKNNNRFYIFFIRNNLNLLYKVGLYKYDNNLGE